MPEYFRNVIERDISPQLSFEEKSTMNYTKFRAALGIANLSIFVPELIEENLLNLAIHFCENIGINRMIEQELDNHFGGIDAFLVPAGRMVFPFFRMAAMAMALLAKSLETVPKMLCERYKIDAILEFVTSSDEKTATYGIIILKEMEIPWIFAGAMSLKWRCFLVLLKNYYEMKNISLKGIPMDLERQWHVLVQVLHKLDYLKKTTHKVN